MKNKKLLICLFMFTFLFLTMNVKADRYNLVDTDDSALMKRNLDRASTATIIDSKLKEYYEGEYPSYYGGMYIDDNCYHLILQIVKDNLPNENSIEYDFYKNLTDKEDIIIEYVKNSFNDLNETNNKVTDLFSNKIDSYNTMDLSNIKISSNYIDVKNNKINIEVYENSGYKSIELMKMSNKYNNIFNNNMINFKVIDKLYNLNYTLDAGSGISTNNGGACSVGYRLKYNGMDGYVTAGHCIKGQKTIPSGTVVMSQYENNQYYDYGFVATNSSFTVSNNLAYTSPNGNVTKLNPGISSPVIVVGTKIAKVGYVTKYTSGEVIGLNQTVYYQNYNTIIKGLTLSNVYSENGDSGGVVIIPNDGSSSGALVAGILDGGNSDNMSFTNINTMPTEFQLGRY